MSVIKSAKTVEEAVKLALNELTADISDVDVKVIEKPKSGFLGFGSRDALVEVSLKNEKEFEKSDRSSDIIPLDSISNSMIK